MPKFNVGDHIMDINSGQEYIVMSLDIAYGTSAINCFERYKLARTNDGAVFEVVGDAINNFCLSKDFLLSGFVPSSGHNNGINLDEIECADLSPGIFPPGFIDKCQHDWVTWTGLHGTKTDCSKCKEIRND